MILDIKLCHAFFKVLLCVLYAGWPGTCAMTEIQYLNVLGWRYGQDSSSYRWCDRLDSSLRRALRWWGGQSASSHYRNNLRHCPFSYSHCKYLWILWRLIELHHTVICFCFQLFHCYCEVLFTKWLKCAIKQKWWKRSCCLAGWGHATLLCLHLMYGNMGFSDNTKQDTSWISSNCGAIKSAEIWAW